VPGTWGRGECLGRDSTGWGKHAHINGVGAAWHGSAGYTFHCVY